MQDDSSPFSAVWDMTHDSALVELIVVHLEVNEMEAAELEDFVVNLSKSTCRALQKAAGVMALSLLCGSLGRFQLDVELMDVDTVIKLISHNFISIFCWLIDCPSFALFQMGSLGLTCSRTVSICPLLRPLPGTESNGRSASSRSMGTWSK